MYANSLINGKWDTHGRVCSLIRKCTCDLWLEQSRVKIHKVDVWEVRLQCQIEHFVFILVKSVALIGESAYMWCVCLLVWYNYMQNTLHVQSNTICTLQYLVLINYHLQQWIFMLWAITKKEHETRWYLKFYNITKSVSMSRSSAEINLWIWISAEGADFVEQDFLILHISFPFPEYFLSALVLL